MTVRQASRRHRALVGFAAVVLFATAAFHAIGYGALRDEVETSALSSFYRSSLPGIWLFFSWHITAVAFALSWVSLRASPAARPLLTFAAVLVCVDTVFVFSLAGFFAGTVLLAVAAACTVTAAALWKSHDAI